MTLQQIDTQAIKDRADLRDIAATYTTLRSESRDEMSGPCPKCGGSKRFHCTKELWMCRDCHPKWADVIEFFVWKDGASFKEAAALATGGALPTTTNPVQPSKPVRKPREWDEAEHLVESAQAIKLLEGKHGTEGREYLQSRGITLETAQAFKVGFYMAGLPGTWNQETKSRTYPKQWAIMFPWLDSAGSLVGVRYRFLQKHTYIDISGKVDANCELIPRIENKSSEYGSDFTGAFGWQAIKGPERCNVLIITEGEMNALALWQASKGLIDVLSPGTEKKVEVLRDDIATFAQQYQHVIVWADKGNIADNAALAIGAHSMRSPNGLDANDLLKAGKLEKLLAAMLDKIGATVEAPSPSAQPIDQDSHTVTDEEWQRIVAQYGRPRPIDNRLPFPPEQWLEGLGEVEAWRLFNELRESYQVALGRNEDGWYIVQKV